MAQLAQLIVLMGPIASGKSTVSSHLAERLLESGRRAAVVDLDDVAECFVAPDQEWADTWRRARVVHDELVSSFRRCGVDFVIAHGSFFYANEPPAALNGIYDTSAIRVLLNATYDVALERVERDPERGITKDPGFLKWTHDQFAERSKDLPQLDLEFDTTAEPVDAIVDAIYRRVAPA